ncbi:MAG: AI-2E family transporter, partial [Endozoicomonas sp.]
MLAGIVLVAVGMVHFLGPVLAPFVVSMVLAYLGDPLADRLESWEISRGLSVAIVFLTLFGVLITAFFVVVPLLVQQVKTVFQLLPVWEAWGRSNVLPLLQEQFDIDPALFDLSELSRKLAGQWQKAGGMLASLGVSVSRSSIAFLGFMVNLFLVPVVTFYLLRDWDKLLGSFKVMIPRNVEPVVSALASECDEVLGAFLKGQLMVMLALGVVYSIGLTLIGLQFAILIGMMAGLVSIIPYMGFA